MAKVNIFFNGTDYLIDEAALEQASTELKTHFSSVMNGSGATINFGGVSYNVDSTKLSNATNDFITHLGTIAGTGAKVVIGGVEYGIDSNKVADAIANLEAILNGLAGGSGDSGVVLTPGLYQTGAIALFREGNVEDASAMMTTSWEELEASGAIAISEGEDIELPDMNEYGFYYGVPYSATMGSMTFVFTFNEDGSAIMNMGGEIMEAPAGLIIYGDHSIDLTALNLPVFIVFADGTAIEAEGLTCTVGSGLPPKGSVYLGTVNGERPLFEGDLVLPNDGSATAIAASAFYNQELLTGIVIPNSVISLGRDAFSKCTSLASITIPDSVTSIGGWAFENCSSLTSINIPDGVTSIDESTFDGCTGLTNVTIGNSVTSIGHRAFVDCSSLTSITIPDSVTSIGISAFCNCTSLTNATIGRGITSITYGPFENCSSLTSINIPDGVTSIGVNAFSKCTSLASITIPDSVTSIADYAFRYCSSLANITFEGTVAEWYALTQGLDWDDGILATEVVCSDGQVSLIK